MVYSFAHAEAAPGTQIALNGVLLNDTDSALSQLPPKRLQGTWVDSRGQQFPAQFTLRTSPDPVELPVNTFARIAWTGTLPAGTSGPLLLYLEGVDDTLLAINAGTDPSGRPVSGDGRHHTAIAGGLSPNETGGPGPSASDGAAAPLEGQGLSAPSQTPALSPFETFRNAITPYEPMYFIVGPTGGANARFQLSFKYRLHSPKDAAKAHFMDHWYLGYTQTSLWDLHSDSLPFVDTTYNPSLFWARDSIWADHNKRWFIGLNSGVEHASNGKDGDDSRSLNDVYLQPEFNHRFDGGSTLSFMPRFKYYFTTDPDMHYPDYMGYVDWKVRWAQDDGLMLSGLYRQGTGSHNAIELNAAWPLKRTFLNMNGYLYMQYFRGYGETLLNYDRRDKPQFRIGIALVP